MNGRENRTRLLKKQDVVLIAILLALAGCLAAWFQLRPVEECIAVVEQNGQVIRRIDLDLSLIHI